MSSEDFYRQCRENQDARKKLSAHLPLHEYCAEICCGKNIPKEIEFKTLSQMLKEREMATTNTSGTCAMCGQVKNLKQTRGKRVCSVCEFIRRGVANDPEIIVATMREFYGDDYFVPPEGAISPAAQNQAIDILADIRAELGCGDNVLLADLPGIVKNTVRRSTEMAMTATAVQEEMVKSQSILTDISLAIGGDPLPIPSDLPDLVSNLMHEYNEIKTLVDNDPPTEIAPVSSPPMSFPRVPDGYKSLCQVLTSAIQQASGGKGRERHAKPGEPFEKQKICEITRRVGLGYPLGQAIKKAEESLRLGDRGPAEILGAINYLAAAYLVMDEEISQQEVEDLSKLADAA